MQQATHPDALYQTVSQTGLALRDNVPRIYVIAGAGGGSSGYLADLGYAVRRLLQADAPPRSAGDGLPAVRRAGRPRHAAGRSRPTSTPR